MVWLAVPKSLMEFSAVALLLGLLLGLRLMSPESFSGALPKAGVFAMALVQLLPALTNFGRMRMEVLGAAAEAESVYHSLTGPMPRRRDGTKVLRSFERAIVFENVSFGYEEREILFEGLNLVIEKGRVTAIVGPSGVGKTTLINLILGLYGPSAGRILIDGVPLQEVKLETWLDKIGFVSQDPFIYHATVADNIVFGRNGHSMQRVVEAAKIANADGFITEFPEGYETVVGERGMKLSGGQQQRIAIARAILDDPEILILDEATSSLDSISEKLVQEAIENASKDRTVLIIAHRLSTVRYADKIIVLDAGRVVEEGSHQELIGRQGHYARLVTSFKDS
jgi:ABC-type multidrug transport system fused ATPase/permease subunit